MGATSQLYDCRTKGSKVYDTASCGWNRPNQTQTQTQTHTHHTHTLSLSFLLLRAQTYTHMAMPNQTEEVCAATELTLLFLAAFRG